MPAKPKNIVVIGSSGAIARAFIKRLADDNPEASIKGFSRHPDQAEHASANILHQLIDYEDESSIARCAQMASSQAPIDLLLVGNGILHDAQMRPEKSLKDLSAENFQRVFATNTILPALIAKHFLPKLNRKSPSIFAALTARVGSISDNRLGGWYAYRASKAALNMIIKNAAIEVRRTNKQAIVVGLHPGTVDSDLSKPFQGNVPEGKLFTPDYSAGQLLAVLATLSSEHSGKCFAWDGQEIQA